MATAIKYIILAAVLFNCPAVMAQKPKSPVIKPIQKFTPPKLTTLLGIRSDSAIVYKEEAVQLVALPLKITDAKKNVYTISSYRFMYKRRAVTEDEGTGKVTPIMSNVSDLFRETPLPKLWVNIISEQIRPGEELFYYDIVAKDAQGRLMFAPTLSIKIK